MINFLMDLTPPIIWRLMLAIKKKLFPGEPQPPAVPETIEKVYQFYTTFPDFRTDIRCSMVLNMDIAEVQKIKQYLYAINRLGAYTLGLQGPPHALMREKMINDFHISPDAKILEIGPGMNPLFPKAQYNNAIGVDKYGVGGQKLFYGNVINASSVADYQGSYSTLNEIEEIQTMISNHGCFDLVTGCHSFEHETMPIKGLRNIHQVLKPGGRVILFVPDGFSDDIVCRDSTHTMYLTPEMIQELFTEAGGFIELEIESFRPNFDLMITAIKKS